MSPPEILIAVSTSLDCIFDWPEQKTDQDNHPISYLGNRAVKAFIIGRLTYTERINSILLVGEIAFCLFKNKINNPKTFYEVKKTLAYYFKAIDIIQKSIIIYTCATHTLSPYMRIPLLMIQAVSLALKVNRYFDNLLANTTFNRKELKNKIT